MTDRIQGQIFLVEDGDVVLVKNALERKIGQWIAANLPVEANQPVWFLMRIHVRNGVRAVRCQLDVRSGQVFQSVQDRDLHLAGAINKVLNQIKKTGLNSTDGPSQQGFPLSKPWETMVG